MPNFYITKLLILTFEIAQKHRIYICADYLIAKYKNYYRTCMEINVLMGLNLRIVAIPHSNLAYQ